MSYDWEKIFKTKTNKELYDKLAGKMILPKEVLEYARAELEYRNFYFNNMAANKTAWEISSLIEEEEFARLGLSGNKAKHISIKILLLIITGIFIIYILLSSFSGYDFPMEIPLFFSFLASIYILMNNFFAKKQKQTPERLEKIKELKEMLEKENLLTAESPMKKELSQQRTESQKVLNTFSYVVVIAFLISLLIKVLSRFF